MSHNNETEMETPYQNKRIADIQTLEQDVQCKLKKLMEIQNKMRDLLKEQRILHQTIEEEIATIQSLRETSTRDND